MYTFIAGAGLSRLATADGMSPPELLASSARDMVAVVPELGVPLRIDVISVPEIDGGWAMIRPEVGPAPSLVTDATDRALACVVFGQVDGEADAARAVLAAFAAGGVDVLAELNGVFSAVVVERQHRRLHVFTSVPGCRTLRYQVGDGALALSPTDLGVVALSRCPVVTDAERLATVVACGWPLAGGSCLEAVGECQPFETLSWQDGAWRSKRRDPLDAGSRIASADVRNIRAAIDQTIEELRTGVRRQLEQFGADPLMVPLTAGIDSRAVLALVLSVTRPGELRTFTRGDGSQDVRVARRLSEHLGIRHEVRPVERPPVTAFLDNARYLATMTNGISNADAAVAAPLGVKMDAPTPGGGAGEVFRGYYYNYLRRRALSFKDHHDLAQALLSSPLARLGASHFADPRLDGAARQRLIVAIDGLRSFSEDPFDLADSFYVFERMGRWGAVSWRRALGPSFVPFANLRAIRAAFRLPAPIGDHAIIATIIRRHASARAYWTPINGAELLVLSGAGPLRYAARELSRGGAILIRKARQRLLPRERTPRQMRQAQLTEHFASPIEALLRSSGSVASELFTKSQVDAMLRSSGRLRDDKLLGATISLELWRKALREVVARPRSRTGTGEPNRVRA